MADFDPPFAHANSAKRPPTVEEVNEGFGCGPADINLFNFLFYCLQAEINEVIKAGGLTPSNDSKTQLRDAIQSFIPSFNDTNTFINAINSDSNGGVVNVNNNNQFVFSRSDGRTWTLQIPQPEAPPNQGIEYLTSPATILNVSQAKSSGDFDTGNVTLNLNNLSGVTVPAGASGVILQAATSINGNQDRAGLSDGSTIGFVSLQAGGQTTSQDFTTVAQVPNLVSYTDTNLGANDNDNTSYPPVPIVGNNLTYRGRVRWGNSTGVDQGRIVLRLIGFTL